MEVVLRAPAAVRRGWGGARAGGRPERGVGQPEGGPGGARSRPLFANGRLPGRGEHRAGGSGSIRPEPWAAGLLRQALRPRTRRSQVELSSPRRAAGSSGRTRADGRSRPPLRPFPFAFIRGDKSAVRQPAFQFTDNDSCMKIDRGALHRRALSPPALLLLPAAPPRVPPPPPPPPHPLRLSQWWDAGRGDNQKGGVLVGEGGGEPVLTSVPSPRLVCRRCLSH